MITPSAIQWRVFPFSRAAHNTLIAQAQKKPHPSIDQMIDFILAALAPRGRK